MNRGWVLKKTTVYILFLCFACIPKFCFAGHEEDPIKATQSGVVAVTKELLTREGEPGPASPTFKMSDTSIFLVKKPYQQAEIQDINKITVPGEEFSPTSWEDWFSGEEESEDNSKSEPIDRK